MTKQIQGSNIQQLLAPLAGMQAGEEGESGTLEHIQKNNDWQMEGSQQPFPAEVKRSPEFRLQYPSNLSRRLDEEAAENEALGWRWTDFRFCPPFSDVLDPAEVFLGSFGDVACGHVFSPSHWSSCCL